MRVFFWHVHGSWTTALVQGEHEYLLPVLPGRGRDGRGRARTWEWPANAMGKCARKIVRSAASRHWRSTGQLFDAVGDNRSQLHDLLA